MKTERRALTAEETEQLYGTSYPQESWTAFILLSVTIGVSCAVLVAITTRLLDYFTGLNLNHLVGGSMDNLMLIVGVPTALAGYIYLWTHELNWRKSYKQNKTRVLASDDLLIELYEVKDCKLVRDPEHGQPMFFVRCDDASIHCILGGEVELYEDWDEHPSRLEEDARPRVDLKVIRDLETKKSLFEQFSGAALPVDECFIMNAHPDKWPLDGKVLSCQWEDIDKDYQLETMVAAERMTED